MVEIRIPPVLRADNRRRAHRDGRRGDSRWRRSAPSSAPIRHSKAAGSKRAKYRRSSTCSWTRGHPPPAGPGDAGTAGSKVLLPPGPSPAASESASPSPSRGPAESLGGALGRGGCARRPRSRPGRDVELGVAPHAVLGHVDPRGLDVVLDADPQMAFIVQRAPNDARR